MLRKLEYEVITAKRAADAFCIVQEKENGIDLVLTEARLPDKKMYELLQSLGKISDLPIVLMSADSEESAILGSYSKGAVFYFVKPLMMNDAKNIWQFAYISKIEKMMALQRVSGFCGESRHDDTEDIVCDERMEKQGLLFDERKEQEDMGDNLAVARSWEVVWTNELHDKFLQAVKVLGIDNAHPKNILEHMNVQGLTRENVSSHLKEYLISLKKEQESIQKNMRKYHAESHLAPYYPSTCDLRGGPQLLKPQSMSTEHQPAGFNVNVPMYMPSLGSIHPKNRREAGPDRVPNFMHGQSTPLNSLPYCFHPNSSQFGSTESFMGRLPSSNQLKNHTESVLGKLPSSNQMKNHTFEDFHRGTMTPCNTGGSDSSVTAYLELLSNPIQEEEEEEEHLLMPQPSSLSLPQPEEWEEFAGKSGAIDELFKIGMGSSPLDEYFKDLW